MQALPHEAHHMVPNSELRGPIEDVGKDTPLEADLIRLIRGGLLNEGYNLNDKLNMIILPMCLPASKALGLPTHRKTAATRSPPSVQQDGQGASRFDFQVHEARRAEV
jgi:A nuclease family of the HNH/ENDO VII superfamily with conserved AHH